MDSFQTLYTLAQKGAQDETSAMLAYLKADINQGVHILEGELDLPPLERTRSITTTTLDTYPLPQDFVRLKHLYVTISNIRYSATLVQDEVTWQLIKAQTTNATSNFLTHVFVRPGSNQFEIFPKPSSAGNTMTFIYEALTKDMTADDYTTGTITTLANGGIAVTGSGTTFTAAMVGRWFKTDDGHWYLIDTYTSATVIGLKQLYQGTAISAGSSTFTIAEMSRLPIQFQRMPVSYALWRHYLERKRDPLIAKIYEAEWERRKALAETYTNKHVSSIVPSARRLRRQFTMRNINNYPQDLS